MVERNLQRWFVRATGRKDGEDVHFEEWVTARTAIEAADIAGKRMRGLTWLDTTYKLEVGN